jgi:hypothetical protein
MLLSLNFKYTYIHILTDRTNPYAIRLHTINTEHLGGFWGEILNIWGEILNIWGEILNIWGDGEHELLTRSVSNYKLLLNTKFK